MTRFTCCAVFVMCITLYASYRTAFAQLGGGGEGEGGAVAAEVGRFDALVRVVTSTIAPDTWEDVGGPGSVQPLDAWGLVIISQTEEVHEQIENLIVVLRQARRAQRAEAEGKFLGDEAKNEPKRESVSILVESASGAVARKRLEAALASETSFEFAELPLADVAEAIGKQHGINVVLDVRALSDVGIAADTLITRKLSGISLRSALRLVLGELDLTFVLHDEVLKISTPENSHHELTTRVYKVEDFAVPAK
ncbi:MAG: hypothetical protein WD873_05990 [Candidatus Hydrogenedentales bacterium]